MTTETTTPDPFATSASMAVEHMNSDHAEAVLAYARVIAGLAWAEHASVQHIDARGLDVFARGAGQSQTVRIAFDQPVSSPEQLRPALVALAERARMQVREPVFVHSPAPERDTHSAGRLLNMLSTRRSFGLKEVSPEPIDLALISQMLEAAIWAPSHGKTEPWRFVVLSGTGRRTLGNALGAAFLDMNAAKADREIGAQSQRERVWQAPVWIALGMQPNPKMPEWEELIAFGSAVQNAHLMASALGLACKWTSGAVARHRLVADAVGFEPATQLFGFLYVGAPVGAWPDSKRIAVADKVRWMGDE